MEACDAVSREQCLDASEAARRVGGRQGVRASPLLAALGCCSPEVLTVSTAAGLEKRVADLSRHDLLDLCLERGIGEHLGSRGQNEHVHRCQSRPNIGYLPDKRDLVR